MSFIYAPLARLCKFLGEKRCSVPKMGVVGVCSVLLLGACKPLGQKASSALVVQENVVTRSLVKPKQNKIEQPRWQSTYSYAQLRDRDKASFAECKKKLSERALKKWHNAQVPEVFEVHPSLDGVDEYVHESKNKNPIVLLYINDEHRSEIELRLRADNALYCIALSDSLIDRLLVYRSCDSDAAILMERANVHEISWGERDALGPSLHAEDGCMANASL